MIIDRTAEVSPSDISHFAWSGLRRFQNVSFSAKHIASLQRTSNSQHRNVIKQAEQLRFCLIQAEEYFRASKSVSLATRPLLLYYGIMSLALAEVLLKQTGESSLDRARSEHAHHGLTLSIGSNPSKLEHLKDSARAISARPLIKSNVRYGTFDLWHRSARETPAAGMQTVHLPEGATQTSRQLLLIGADDRMAPIPDQGMTLLDCLTSIPNMRVSLARCDVDTLTARATLSETFHTLAEKRSYSCIIQPSSQEALERTYDGIIAHPALISDMDIKDLGSGCIIRWERYLQSGVYPLSFPITLQETSEVIHFCPANKSLNEFGLFYVGLYMLGNYARYYPDQWMADIEKSSDLSLAATEFIFEAERRVPLLNFSELSRVWHVIKE